MPAMSKQEIDAFLGRAVLARIATVRRDGRPHIAPMWFWWDGTDVYMETPPDSVKARNLRANPRCAVSVDVSEGGLRFKAVVFEGQAELLTERAVQLEIATRIYSKYLGSEGVLSDTPQQMINNEHVIIRFTPSNVVSFDDTHSGLAPIP